VRQYTCARCGETKLETIPATGHTLGDGATCLNPGTCVTCGAVLDKAIGHNFKTVVTDVTCLQMGYTTYTCDRCGFTYKSDYTDPLGHDHVAHVTEPTCTEGGYTTYICSRCGDSYVDDYTDALGHAWDEGRIVADSVCDSEGVMEYRCERCGYHRLEAVSEKGHTLGAEATCTQPQLCVKCGAVIADALGHDYKAEVTAPTCTEMGYTTYTCTRCGDSYKGDYTDATGHKLTDWIIDQEPTTDAEGSKHKECENCGETLETAPIEKLYLSATTDSKGEAIVGGYLVIVTDTDTKNPVANATVNLSQDDTLSIRLPNSRLLDYADQTTVTVLLTKDKSPVEGIFIAVTDKNSNYAADKTDSAGQITIPGTSGQTNSDGNVTVGWQDADGNRWTLTVKVEDYETGRPIEGADVSIGSTGNITVKLPDGTDMDENNRVTVTVTDNQKKPQEGVTVIVNGDLNQTATGKTDEDGKLIVPAVTQQEKHGAYIVGYTDGTFGPERDMARSEAAAIFARLLAEKNGDTITTVASTKYSDIPANAWYSGYVKYLSNYGVIYGRGDDLFAPNDAITRAEFTAMAVRFFDVYGDGAEDIMEQYKDFSDVSSGYWAAEYIQDASIHGWILGYSDGTFQPDQNIARAEVVTLVNRLLDRTADQQYVAQNLNKLNTFSDMESSHWAYYAVMEAANGHVATLGDTETWSK
jgi:DNA-directed RNA polymerase subunit RPC12/RpoP